LGKKPSEKGVVRRRELNQNYKKTTTRRVRSNENGVRKREAYRGTQKGNQSWTVRGRLVHANGEENQQETKHPVQRGSKITLAVRDVGFAGAFGSRSVQREGKKVGHRIRSLSGTLPKGRQKEKKNQVLKRGATIRGKSRPGKEC